MTFKKLFVCSRRPLLLLPAPSVQHPQWVSLDEELLGTCGFRRREVSFLSYRSLRQVARYGEYPLAWAGAKIEEFKNRRIGFSPFWATVWNSSIRRGSLRLRWISNISISSIERGIRGPCSSDRTCHWASTMSCVTNADVLTRKAQPVSLCHSNFILRPLRSLGSVRVV